MNHTRRRTRLHRQRAPGQALVETTLMLGILVVLMLGMIDGFQWIMARNTVQQTARVAAHQAALIGSYDGDNGVVVQAARQSLDGGAGGMLTADKMQISGTCANDPCRRYDPITVSIAYTDRLWVPLPGLMENYAASSTITRAAEQDQQAGS